MVTKFLFFALTRIYCDGAFIPDIESPDLYEPEQKALIVHDGKTEVMTLQVKYAASKGSFCWLVPTPSIPTIRLGSDSLFVNLHEITKPIIIYDKEADNSYGLNKENENRPDRDVVVHKEASIGPYDYVVLSGRNHGEIVDWLNGYKYKVGEKAETLIKEYSQKKWVFTVFRINMWASLINIFNKYDLSITDSNSGVATLKELIVNDVFDRKQYNESRIFTFTSKLLEWANNQKLGANLYSPELGYSILSRILKPNKEKVTANLSSYFHNLVSGVGSVNYLKMCMDQIIKENKIDLVIGNPIEFITSKRYLAFPKIKQFLLDEISITNQSEIDIRGLVQMWATLRIRKDLLQRGFSLDSNELTRQAVEELEKGDFNYNRSIFSKIPTYDGISSDKYSCLYQLYHGLNSKKALSDLLNDALSNNAAITQWASIEYDIQYVVHILRFYTDIIDRLNGRLHSGTITPIVFEFKNDELIYPLKISSLNNRGSTILLYVVSSTKVQSNGMSLKYAGRLAKSDLPKLGIVNNDNISKPFLTKLAVTLVTSDMKDDIILQQADNNEEYREKLLVPNRD